MPFPSEDTTPPVMKMYLVIQDCWGVGANGSSAWVNVRGSTQAQEAGILLDLQADVIGNCSNSLTNRFSILGK